MQNPSSVHHYIPIFWTKKWAATASDGKVVRFERPYRDVIDRRVTPARCFWQRDLYAIPSAGGHSQILEEKFFKKIDDVAARALDKMLLPGRQPLTQTETSGWISFILSLFHRSPENMRVTKEAGRLVWRSTLSSLEDKYDSVRGPDDPRTFEEYLAERDVVETEQSLMRTFPRFVINEAIAEHLRSISWMKLHVPPDAPELLLSDDPLARSNGIKNPGGHLAMPLAPRLLMIMAPEQKTIEAFRRTPIKTLVKIMNRWTVQSARHFVVSSDLAQAIFVKKHFGADPKRSLNQGVIEDAQRQGSNVSTNEIVNTGPPIRQ